MYRGSHAAKHIAEKLCSDEMHECRCEYVHGKRTSSKIIPAHQISAGHEYGSPLSLSGLMYRDVPVNVDDKFGSVGVIGEDAEFMSLLPGARMCAYGCFACFYCTLSHSMPAPQGCTYTGVRGNHVGTRVCVVTGSHP